MTADDLVRAPAVLRAGRIVEMIAGASGAAIGVSELARRLDIPKSSVSNICAPLEQLGVLERTATGYVLGSKLAVWGGAYLDANDKIGRFYGVVQSLPTISMETVQLAVLAGIDVVYVARHDGVQPISLASAIGRSLPASITATGKAILASLSDDELERRLSLMGDLPRLTPNSITTVEDLRKDIMVCRERGYAVDREETAVGIVCFGVAIPDFRPGDNPYAISCTLVGARLTPELTELVIADLQEVSDLLRDPFERRAKADDRA
jgi:DNA-binding IclR family transcriptional regulator